MTDEDLYVEDLQHGPDTILFATKNDKWRVVQTTSVAIFNDGTEGTPQPDAVVLYNRNPLYDPYDPEEPEWLDVTDQCSRVPITVLAAYHQAMGG